MSTTKTTITVSVYGGPLDGWHGQIRFLSTVIEEGKIRVNNEVYEARRSETGHEMYLVHPSAVSLWP